MLSQSGPPTPAVPGCSSRMGTVKASVNALPGSNRTLHQAPQPMRHAPRSAKATLPVAPFACGHRRTLGRLACTKSSAGGRVRIPQILEMATRMICTIKPKYVLPTTECLRKHASRIPRETRTPRAITRPAPTPIVTQSSVLQTRECLAMRALHVLLGYYKEGLGFCAEYATSPVMWKFVGLWTGQPCGKCTLPPASWSLLPLVTRKRKFYSDFNTVCLLCLSCCLLLV